MWITKSERQIRDRLNVGDQTETEPSTSSVSYRRGAGTSMVQTAVEAGVPDLQGHHDGRPAVPTPLRACGPAGTRSAGCRSRCCVQRWCLEPRGTEGFGNAPLALGASGFPGHVEIVKPSLLLGRVGSRRSWPGPSRVVNDAGGELRPGRRHVTACGTPDAASPPSAARRF